MRKLLLFTFLMICSFCNAQKKGDQKTDSLINDLLILPPISSVNYIYTGNHLKTDTEESEKATTVLEGFLKDLLPDRIRFEYLKSDSSGQTKMDSSILYMLSKVTKGYKDWKTKIPQCILDSMDAHNKNYAIGFFFKSFQRTEENMVNQVIKDQSLSFVVSLGSIIITPIEFGSGMVCYIIDSKNKKLIYFRKSVLNSRTPSDKYTIKGHLYNLLSHYFK